MSSRAFGKIAKSRAAMEVFRSHNIKRTLLAARGIAPPHGVLYPWPLLPDHA
ncbi:hypothetical protein [Bordetella sp. H567]|uniref:hypothetical protein n=1 Tax=Bordetella sp. H567 TaxID=1697043 RepID=UPI001314A08D|nr:hypothetical protein [Bordetella sp. H567]